MELFNDNIKIQLIGLNKLFDKKEIVYFSLKHDHFFVT